LPIGSSGVLDQAAHDGGVLVDSDPLLLSRYRSGDVAISEQDPVAPRLDTA
jgi:hypothetical protein